VVFKFELQVEYSPANLYTKFEADRTVRSRENATRFFPVLLLLLSKKGKRPFCKK